MSKHTLKLEEAEELIHGIDNIYLQKDWEKKIGKLTEIAEKIDPAELEPGEMQRLYFIKGKLAFLGEKYDEAKQLTIEALKYKKSNELKSFLSIIEQHKTRNSRINNKYNALWARNQVRLIHELLGRGINVHNTEFLPDNDFYANWYGRSEDLQNMAAKLFIWLGIDIVPGTIIDFYNISPPGLFLKTDDGNDCILVNSSHKADPFICGAILAHEIMHLYLTRHGIRLIIREDNERFTDVSTMDAGFGVLIINGMSYTSYWLVTLIAALFGRIYWKSESLTFGYFTGKEYAQLYMERLRRRERSFKETLSYIIPNAYRFIPISKIASALSKSQNVLINRIKRKYFILLSVQLVIALVVVSIGFNIYSSDGSTATTSPEVSAQLTALKSQYEACTADLATKKAVLDSLNKRMDSADAAGNISIYNSLVPQQNSQVNAYNNEISQCENLRNKYNGLIK